MLQPRMHCAIATLAFLALVTPRVTLANAASLTPAKPSGAPGPPPPPAPPATTGAPSARAPASPAAVPPSPPAPRAAENTPAPPPAGPSRRARAGWFHLGVGAALVVVSISLAAASAVLTQEIEDAPPGTFYSSVAPNYRAAKRETLAAQITGVAAGALVLTGVTLLIWDRVARSREAPSVQVGVTRGGAVVHWEARF